MTQDVKAFRAHYRANVHPRYNAWLHGGFVLAYGIAAIAFFLKDVARVSAFQWATVPFTFLLFNWLEFTVHRHAGHFKRRFGAMFYRRHTGDHHSFFSSERMTYRDARDWRVILFPAWLIVVFSVGLFAVHAVLSRIDANFAGLFASTMLGGYLLYEFLHACEHLPDTHPLATWPWIRQMRTLHRIHHRNELMRTCNFDVILPLMDWLHGTLRWNAEPQAECSTFMRHEIDIARRPAAVLAYASTAACWPEWHPSSLRVDGPAGPLAAGSRFEEDVRAAGRVDHLRWDVVRDEAGAIWQARAVNARGDLRILLTYECRDGARGARFIRTLQYHSPNPLLRLANALVMRKRVERESAHSLTLLKRRLEDEDACGARR
ncbi:sterol desaturase [Burkholderia sp. ABCPW 14]|uniref:sterol desaturase/SRPBCC family protein n=1 Tax=Burkholderia sp. ABCPW 14 TaxID=1637860 RepID=UPI000770D434|nr:SRPBCC family protein [Burkholderia sp. ABCPW 14]KVD80594.1 sterol desaturase [Burkholderia sp. ABCPW 14]